LGVADNISTVSALKGSDLPYGATAHFHTILEKVPRVWHVAGMVFRLEGLWAEIWRGHIVESRKSPYDDRPKRWAT